MLKAREEGNLVLEFKHKIRSMKVTPKMRDDLLLSLKLLGINVIQSDSDGEALCASLCKEGVLDYTATEDIDALAFGCPKWVKGLNQGSKDIFMVELKGLLEELNFTQEEFIDLSILCGCDYSTSIKGMGPVNSYKLLKKNSNIENILKEIETSKKFKIPENFEYEKARDVFKRDYKSPSSIISEFLPDEAYDFLVNEKNFNPDRIRKVINEISNLK